MKHGSLFSGIGGFDLAAQWMGWDNVFHCEWMPFPRKILSHYWPEAVSYHDITTTDFRQHLGQIDILTGGFPCQPYSAAGKRKGKDDDRHLWPHMLRCIREVKPRWVVGENVFGLATWNGGLVFEEVCTDLEAEGYTVQPYVLPAAAVNAPHRRDRVWFVAYAKGERNRKQQTTNCGKQNRQYYDNGKIGTAAYPHLHGFQQRHGNDEEHASQGGQYAQRDFEQSNGDGNATDANGNGLQGCISADFNRQQRSVQIDAPQCISAYGAAVPFEDFPTVAPICGGDDGLPTELDGITFSKWRNESIKAYGNAIVPQVAYQIFKAIQETI